MRTSYNETKLIDQYLNSTISSDHKSKFESKLQKSKRLQLKLFYQKITYKIIQLYNREQLKIELEEIHDTIFSNPRKKEFHNRINKIFEIQQ